MVQQEQILFCINCNHNHKFYDPTESYICTERMCFCQRFETASIGKPGYDKIKNTLDNTYDKIEWILDHIPEMRELNNKQFIFAYWHYEFNFCPGMLLDVKTYYYLTDPETVRRAKQKLVEKRPELGPKNDELIIAKGIKKGAIEQWLFEK